MYHGVTNECKCSLCISVSLVDSGVSGDSPTVSDLRAVKNSESLVENGVSSGSVISYGL